ncbi:MAG: EAL domain-containing protein [Betaproteobacteria bacterium]|nr:EAL domain-containing protein [Betaproteobacteria bacterium]
MHFLLLLAGLILVGALFVVWRRNRRLRAGGTLARAMMDSMAEGLVMLDARGCITASNPAAERILGLSADEILGRMAMDPSWRPVHEDGSPYPAEDHPSMVTLHTGQPRTGVVMGVSHPVRGRIWLSVSSRLLERSADSGSPHVVVTFSDISLHQESHAYFTSLVDNLQSAVLMADGERRVLAANQRFCDLFGLPGAPASLLGTDCIGVMEKIAHLFVAPEPFLARIGELVTRRELVLEEEWVLGDGRILKRDYVPIRLNDKRHGHLWVYRDVTLRRRASDLLKEREAYLSALLDNLPMMVWLKDAQSRYLTANALVAQACGVSDKSWLTGKSDLDLWPDDIAQRYRAGDQEVMTECKSILVEEPIETLQGRRLIETFKTAVFDPEGRLLGTAGFARDITARRQAELALRESEQRWQFALEGAGHGVWDLDVSTGRMYYSPAWKTMLGYAEEEIGDTLREWCDRTHPEELAPCQGELMACLEGKNEFFTSERRMRCKNGAWRWFLARGKVIEREDDGTARRVIGTLTDITEQKESEERLRQAATVFAASTEAIMVTGADGIIKAVNPAFTEITGYTPAEAIGHTPRLLKSGHHDADYYHALWHALQHQGRWEGEVWNRRKNGKIYPEWQSITAVRDPYGQIIEYVSVFSDITRRKLTEEEVRYRANYDVLTGLPNRSLLMERLELALQQAQRDQRKVAVLFLDLDHFKQVNDTLGHALGDRLLQEAAAVIRGCVRISDTVARLGGDEFVLTLDGIDHSDDAAMVAGKIIEALVAPFLLEGNEVRIGASVGITVFPDDGNDVSTLFRNADLAMYRAKDSGRNNFQFFEAAMTRHALERRSLETELRHAFAREELRLHYQPITRLGAQPRTTSLEALLRWPHAERGMVPPDVFIPLAEEIGLIRELGVWVVDRACDQLAQWRAQGLDIRVAVNVSVRQIPDGLPPEQIAAIVARHGLSPDDLILEITEGVVLADTDRTRQWLASVRAAGFKLSLDDFGTGYSSLAYLKRLPVDHVKIDKTFVRDMTHDPSDLALVEGILTICQRLGLEVVAEGVETAAQYDMLQNMGCTYAQGYLLSAPIPAERVPETVARLARG